MNRAAGVLGITFFTGLLAPSPSAQEPTWEFDVSAAVYFLPDEENFLQPTVRADHRRLHLETRHNYEDRSSTSFFMGANFDPGGTVELALTPMLGIVLGETDGIVPALEGNLTVGSFEAYAEAEYVFDLQDSESDYFYLWSELSFRPTERWRAGLVGQRTRVYRTDRDIQRGLLLGLSFRRLEGTVYVFNPTGEDTFTVMSVGLSF